MSKNQENRVKARFKHVTAVTLEDVQMGVLEGSRMYNFSEHGVYFESDHLLEPGTHLYIGMKNSPYADEPDVYECYRARIQWRRPLENSAYYYGYGAQFLSKNPLAVGVQSPADSREHPRKSCSLTVKYISGKHIAKGRIKNVSRGGIFLKTDDDISVGQRLTVAIPIRRQGKVLKRSGKVIWKNADGVGIKFQPPAKST